MQEIMIPGSCQCGNTLRVSASLGSPAGVAANTSCTSEHNLKERSDAQIVVSR